MPAADQSPPTKRSKVEQDGPAAWVVCGYDSMVGRVAVNAIRACKHQVVFGLTANDRDRVHSLVRSRPVQGVITCGIQLPQLGEWHAALREALGESSPPVLIHLTAADEEGTLEAEEYPGTVVTVKLADAVVGPVLEPSADRESIGLQLSAWVHEALRGPVEQMVNGTDFGGQLQDAANAWQLVCIQDLKQLLQAIVQSTPPRRAVYDTRISLPTITAQRALELVTQACGTTSSSQGGGERALAAAPGSTETCLDPLATGLVTQWTDPEQLILNLVAQSKEVRRVLQAHIRKVPPTVEGPRGGMVELFGPGLARIYEISITPGYVRGGHYHKIQTENFYVSRGVMSFEMSSAEHPDLWAYITLRGGSSELLVVPPGFIHTVWNPDPDPQYTPTVVISTTQVYVPNSAPDTYYVN